MSTYKYKVERIQRLVNGKMVEDKVSIVKDVPVGCCFRGIFVPVDEVPELIEALHVAVENQDTKKK